MKKTVFALAGLAAVAAGLLYYNYSGRTQPAAAAASSAGPVTAKAAKGSVSVVVEGAALLEANRQVTLRAASPAVLTSVKRSGEKVAANGTVAAMDDSAARNALGQADLLLEQAVLDAEKAALAVRRARKDMEDKKVLYQNKAASRETLTLAEEALRNAELASESADTKVKLSRLAAEKARKELRDATVAAPFDGTVLKTFAEQGDLLGQNAQIALFGDVSRLRVVAEVDEFDIGKVRVGQAVTVSGDAVGESPIRAAIDFISPIAEVVNNISIFTVAATIDNADGRLRPGMSADYSILISSDKGLVVPSKAISTVRGRSYLDVAENGEIVKKRVEIGANDGINTAVLSGIDEGADVVIPGAVPIGVPAATVSSGEKSVLPITVPGAGTRP
jgi:HlyD family secretion protein